MNTSWINNNLVEDGEIVGRVELLNGVYTATANDYANRPSLHNTAFKTEEEARAQVESMREVAKRFGCTSFSSIASQLSVGSKVLDVVNGDVNVISCHGPTCSELGGSYLCVFLEGLANCRKSSDLVVIP